MAEYVGLLSSATRTANIASKVVTVSEKYEAMHVVVDITNGSPNLVVSIKGKDQASGKSYTILDSAILNAVGTTVLKVGPAYTAATNVAKDYLPYNFYVQVTESGGVSATYSIGASLM